MSSYSKEDIFGDEEPHNWTLAQQIDSLTFKLQNLLDFYQENFTLPTEAIIGILEDTKLTYWYEKRIEMEGEIFDDDMGEGESEEFR